MEDRTRARLEQVLDGYFDLRTVTMVERVLGTATPDELADPDALERLFTSFVALLEDRYDRADPGRAASQTTSRSSWRAGAEALLAAEWERQVEAARAFEATLDADRAF